MVLSAETHELVNGMGCLVSPGKLVMVIRVIFIYREFQECDKYEEFRIGRLSTSNDVKFNMLV